MAMHSALCFSDERSSTGNVGHHVSKVSDVLDGAFFTTPERRRCFQ